MTVKEMHVDVSNQLQRLASNRNRKLEEDQIDWNLNAVQQLLVQSAMKPAPGSSRFNIVDQKQDLVNGLVSGRTPIIAAWNTDKYISFLPSDFWYLLDDGSSVTQLCKGESKITNYSVLNITSVPFPFSLGSSNYYNTVQLLYNNNILIDLTAVLLSRQKQYSGMASVKEHFYVKDLLIDLLTKQGISVYWEKFNTIDTPYTLLFVSNSAPVPISLIVDGDTYNGTTQPLTLELHTGTRPSTLTPNTSISQDKGIATSSTPYFKTSYISPISETGSNVLYTYADKSFIVCQTTINYVRKPRTISLSLGTDCSLNPSIHQYLCNQTVITILNRIDDPLWKEAVQQNAVITQ